MKRIHCYTRTLWRNKAAFQNPKRLVASEAQKNHEFAYSAWQIETYSGLSGLKLQHMRDVPAIHDPHDVMVKVKAASVNPLDLAMTNGYGHGLLNVFRYCSGMIDNDNKVEFPLTMGRDFSGEVIGLGHAIKDLKVGDQVWGATLPSAQGSHGEIVVTKKFLVTKKPESLSHEEAAAVPYAGLTAYSALTATAEISSEKAGGTRVLVLGASGGVGHLAVQMLRAWGCQVIAACRTNKAKEFIREFDDSVDVIVSSNQEDLLRFLRKGKRFDVIFDCAALNDNKLESVLKPWSNSKYVTLSSPVLKNINSSGLAFGAWISGVDLLRNNLRSFSLNGSTFRWAYFMPIPWAMESLRKMVDNKELNPKIHKVFHFNNLPEAFRELEKGSIRGKIVVSMK